MELTGDFEEDMEGELEEELADKQRVYAKVNLDALLYNMRSMHEKLPASTQMVGVIKADGYGCGAVPIATVLEQESYVWGFATATAEEAFELRNNGINKPILILGYTFPYCYEQLFCRNIRPVVFREDTLEELAQTVRKCRKFVGISSNAKMKIHIAVDTGMSRIGVKPDDSGLAFFKKAFSYEELEVEGVFTHFAKADAADLSNAKQRREIYTDFVQRVEKETGRKIPLHHCANSASIVRLPETYLELVRAGITIYGMWPSGDVPKDIVPLKPVLSLYSHITFVKDLPAGVEVGYGGTYTTQKDTKVATIPVGYADGYPRSLSNKGEVLIRGRRAPIIGRICMDQFMVDVTNIPGVTEGDLVTLIGEDGEEEITIEELGEVSGRFNYELACDLNKRVPRVYVME